MAAGPSPQSSRLRPLGGTVLTSDKTDTAVHVVIYAGSVLDYAGDAIVNAANRGGVAGFGVDQQVNKACGPDIIPERRAFDGIATGEAKVSGSYNHKRVKKVIHAVGPVFHRDYPAGNRMNSSAEPVELHCQQLADAYRASLLRAHEHKLSSVGFCLLSAGVFRGNQPLKSVLHIGLAAIKTTVEGMLRAADSSEAPIHIREVAVMAFTPEEQTTLKEEFGKVFGREG